MFWRHHLVYTGGTATGCAVGFSLCGAFLRCGCYLERCEVNNMGGTLVPISHTSY